MKRLTRSFACLPLSLALVAIAHAQNMPPAATAQGEPLNAAALAHIAAAKKTGEQFPSALGLCPKRVPVAQPAQTTPGDLMPEPQPNLQPARVFDNLYFVGRSSVSAWAVNTSQGIILIDSLNNFDDAEKIIAGGLKTLGLDPAQIKYVIVTHGHGDHFGGAKYFADKYHARVIMSEADWTLVEAPQTVFSGPNWGTPPQRDMIATDGQRLSLGDTTVTLYVTPGHTPGTVSLVIPVLDRGQKHVAVMWGGTGLGGAEVKRFNSYAASAERFRGIARQAGADTFISNHGAFDGTLEKLAILRTKANAPNPYILGAQNIQNLLTTLGECAKANAAALEK